MRGGNKGCLKNWTTEKQSSWELNPFLNILFFFCLHFFFFWQVERELKNFPEVKRSKGMERREFDNYNEEKDK